MCGAAYFRILAGKPNNDDIIKIMCTVYDKNINSFVLISGDAGQKGGICRWVRKF
jgi:hypothetical protein